MVKMLKRDEIFVKFMEILQKRKNFLEILGKL